VRLNVDVDLPALNQGMARGFLGAPAAIHTCDQSIDTTAVM
jgi:hypothetical protein